MSPKERKNLAKLCWTLAHDWIGFARNIPVGYEEYIRLARLYREYAKAFRRGEDPGFRPFHAKKEEQKSDLVLYPTCETCGTILWNSGLDESDPVNKIKT